jgi:hypothetical protein
MQLGDRLDKMPAYYRRATALAATLSAIDGVSVIPDPPHTNLMPVALAVDAETAKERRHQVARDTGLWLFGGVEQDGDNGCRFELYIGDAALAIEDTEVARAFESITRA